MFSVHVTQVDADRVLTTLRKKNDPNVSQGHPSSTAVLQLEKKKAYMRATIATVNEALIDELIRRIIRQKKIKRAAGVS